MTDQAMLSDSVLFEVADRMGIHHTAIFRGPSKLRSPKPVAARAVAALVLHRHAGRSYPQIAESLGYRSHSSAWDAVRNAGRGDYDDRLPMPALSLAEEVWAALGSAEALPPPRYSGGKWGRAVRLVAREADEQFAYLREPER